jgi:hypothetical protein
MDVNVINFKVEGQADSSTFGRLPIEIKDSEDLQRVMSAPGNERCLYKV